MAKNMLICEIIDCYNEAEFSDLMGNLVCDDHRLQEIEEGTYVAEEYEQLEVSEISSKKDEETPQIISNILKR